ncbi:Glucose-6-phosphate 1-dehydrogenase [Vanrija albida]|uniref:Glucose-6-phosphate 1-dehydrogenase n=1 Tax=Vanrija albida TaxID=181172 RepID=A0ABR3QF46_9TREE
MTSKKRGSIPSMEALGDAFIGETVFVVLGASGDLAKKKTFPALFTLFRQGHLPSDIHIVGYARTKMTPEEFQKRATSYIKPPKNKEHQAEYEVALAGFHKILSYVSGPYDQDSGYQDLETHLREIEAKRAKGEKRNRIFYMALPPSVFTEAAAGLKKNNYSTEGGNRLIVEKPFGKDLESCREMMSALKAEWAESETYRIDHYLGKEMVKNLLVLRFGNIVLDAVLNKNAVSNVQITFKEPFGTEGRGGYFDEFGIIRDVCQNHLLQALSVLTMERPVSFSAEDIRDEKVKVLRAIPPIKPADTLLGQYVAADGKPGYLDDDTVPKGSTCPTFAALTLFINNPRWEGVPFIMKAGKALNEGKVEIRVQFKDVTSGIFTDIARDELVIRIQPDEAVYLKLNSKLPGLITKAIPTELNLNYAERFTDVEVPQAYEALILDAIKGDRSNFVRDDELDVAWKIFTPILHWIDGVDGGEKPKPEPYPYGSRGPSDSAAFSARYGYRRTEEGTYTWPVTSVAANL